MAPDQNKITFFLHEGRKTENERIFLCLSPRPKPTDPRSRLAVQERKATKKASKRTQPHVGLVRFLQQLSVHIHGVWTVKLNWSFISNLVFWIPSHSYTQAQKKRALVLQILNVWSLATQMSYGPFCTQETASGMVFDCQETLSLT